jgi:putative transport protein
MTWIEHLRTADPVVHAVLMLALVSVAGLALGNLRWKGVGLGTAGVLFAGIVIGHLGWTPAPEILGFVRDFGLILFVFTIGLQLGPGFFAALRTEGMRLNLLACGVVLLGSALAAAASAFGIDGPAVLGLLAGATTNTPSLGAAQQTLATLPGVDANRAALTALAYAVAYPVGIAGIIGSMLVLKVVFRIDPVAEAEAFRIEQARGLEPLERRNLSVQNPNLDGIRLGDVPSLRETGVVVSRVRHAGEDAVQIATDETQLRQGDTILAVGTRRMLDRFQVVVGQRSDLDLRQVPSQVTYRRIVVTQREVVGKGLGEIGLYQLFGVAVTRVTRAGLEMTAAPNLKLQFGDVVQAVGTSEGLDQAAKNLGNSVKALNETPLMPFFVGIGLGILFGLVPVAIPGLPQPVRIGLAGGPLVVALLVSRAGRIGPLVWYMPSSANLAFRELGITLFLAAVGLTAGQRFFTAAFSAQGLQWAITALAITMVPLLTVGVIARWRLKLNFVTIGGLLAGSTTDPPALAFASAAGQSDAPALAYATVYPLTMVLRIVTAQVLALLLCR